jgi:hypothetical protein
MKKQTAVEWLGVKLQLAQEIYGNTFEGIIQQAKEMENNRAQEYAEFAIRCDRMNMKILNFEDWTNL